MDDSPHQLCEEMKPAKKNMRRLTESLKGHCASMGAVAFGVASAAALDSLKRVRIKEGRLDKWSIKVRSILPDADSVVMFAIRTLDDADDLEVRRRESRGDYPGYTPLSAIQREVVAVLRDAGFAAVPLPELVPHKRAAMLAGMGVYGKNSLILHSRYGPTLRFYGVATSADLVKSSPCEEDLCNNCVRCIRACPTGVLEPYVMTNPRKCLVDMREAKSVDRKYRKMIEKHEPMLTPNSWKMCTVCQMVCPHTPQERKKGLIRGT